MKYKIGKYSAYLPYVDVIMIGLHSGKNLTEDEVIEAMSDALTHEHIHRALYLHVNIVACCLFDIIGDSFLNIELVKKELKLGSTHEAWSSLIEKYGFKYVINSYIQSGLITMDDVRQELKGWDE